MKDSERAREALNFFVAMGGGAKAPGRDETWELVRLLLDMIVERAEFDIIRRAEREIA